MEEYSAGKLTLGAVEVPLRVTDDGRWLATWNHRRYTDTTRDGLAGQLRIAIKKAAATVRVPFLRLTSRRHGGSPEVLVPGTATGVHMGTGKILFRYPDGSAGQLDGYTSSDTFTTMSPDEQDELLRLRQAATDAQNAFNAYAKPRRLVLREAVAEAIDAAIGEA